jgi:23S rRNA (guanosine2251-2'-O)-methyltransferase
MSKSSRSVVVIAHNLRSSHNVGSLLRTAEGLGVTQVVLSGYTPHPHHADDSRLPHVAQKIHAQISKTALGAETSQDWSYQPDIAVVIAQLHSDGYQIYALEQTPSSIQLPDFEPPERFALILGREVEGVEDDVLALCDGALEIPMFGNKESFNVVQAAAMALYHCTFIA